MYLNISEETTVTGETWIPPNGWTGPDAAVYWSFDSSDGFVLMEGTKEKGLVPLVTGQVNHLKLLILKPTAKNSFFKYFRFV